MRDADVMARLSERGLELPPPPPALAAYVPCVVHGGLAWVAGQVPMVDGVPVVTGLLGGDASMDDAVAGARRAGLQALAVLRDVLGSFDRLERIVQVSVFVACTPAFDQHPLVANGASELLVEVLGEEGRHARAAVGCASLPLGSAVEVAVTAAVR
jgi:enamine deaminase RidA (YjgF/YER057c/UK114 family)